jgi:hypothetical protein
MIKLQNELKLIGQIEIQNVFNLKTTHKLTREYRSKQIYMERQRALYQQNLPEYLKK